MSSSTATKKTTLCYHCGDYCQSNKITDHDKVFCCEGCKMVFQILEQSELCEYYDLNNNPGLTQKTNVQSDKFFFLQDEKIKQQLISYEDADQIHITFYLPQMHCSSCLYLLENIHKINKSVVSSKVNFTRKELSIVFNKHRLSLKEVADLLTNIGYEPYISLNDLKEKKQEVDKQLIYRVGVAGFSFGNIMLMSFPEYLGIDISELSMLLLFRWTNLIIALPVLLYSAYPFYFSAWKGIQNKYLNIDTPIALAIIITFFRSVIEVITGSGGGYFDSMTGIVLFMLVGRIAQNKTYRQLSFERDYTSYFPVAINVVKDGKLVPTALPEIKIGDTLRIHSQELIPADGILTKGKAYIDYSFVTGESIPVSKDVGEILYAGGKQTAGAIELLVIKEVAQSYLTQLWNQESFNKNKHTRHFSFIQPLSRYFTYIVFFIAFLSAVYWRQEDPSKLWQVITSIFIIACPCALLLSNTFTNGNILTILAKNRLFLRNAETIEAFGDIDYIVFDKTGTLTAPHEQKIEFYGLKLTEKERQLVASLAQQSVHPLSKAIVNWLEVDFMLPVTNSKEKMGAGISGILENKLVQIGSQDYCQANHLEKRKEAKSQGTQVHVSIDHTYKGVFLFSNQYRLSIPALLKKLLKRYKMAVLSGDNPSELQRLQQLTNKSTILRFNQQPQDKLNYIKALQEQGKKVMMIGDGLNDAGALKQANIGLAVSENSSHFTPSSDAIIEAKMLPLLEKFITLCKANHTIVVASFIVSIAYNIIGLFFAVQGQLSPLIAAILMPSSSLTIVLMTFGSSSLIARNLGLR
jgi:Cu+-exporting ATPase